jgi:hypothetical protein
MAGALFILDDPIFSGLAVSLLFGLFVSTLLTLVVIPVVYYGSADAAGTSMAEPSSKREVRASLFVIVEPPGVMGLLAVCHREQTAAAISRSRRRSRQAIIRPGVPDVEDPVTQSARQTKVTWG